MTDQGSRSDLGNMGAQIAHDPGGAARLIVALRAEVERLRLIVADLVEGETAEEGTPQWYALRNARGELARGTDEEGRSDG